MPDSDYVFEDGEPITIGSHGDHDYVFSKGEPVPDTGVSDLVFESGVGLGSVGWSYSIDGGEPVSMDPWTDTVSAPEWYGQNDSGNDTMPAHRQDEGVVGLYQNTDTGVFYPFYNVYIDNPDWDILFNDTTLDLSLNLAVTDDAPNGDTYGSDFHHHQGGGVLRDDGGMWDANAFGEFNVTFSLQDNGGNISGWGVWETPTTFVSVPLSSTIRFKWSGP